MAESKTITASSNIRGMAEAENSYRILSKSISATADYHNCNVFCSVGKSATTIVGKSRGGTNMTVT